MSTPLNSRLVEVYLRFNASAHQRTIDRLTLCWMVYLWRAIILNGTTMMHLNILRKKKAATIDLGWRLLLLRVWAAAEECTRMILPTQHAELCASVYSGNPTIMPGWATRGMPIPFIFDIIYMVGVNWSQATSMSIMSANFVYITCFAALLHETTTATAFINGDPFLAQYVARDGVLVTKVQWDSAFGEYARIIAKPIMSRPKLIERSQLAPLNTSETLYNNLISVLFMSEQIGAAQSMFDRIYNGTFQFSTDVSLQYELFYV